jgi:hypothetical protein
MRAFKWDVLLFESLTSPGFTSNNLPVFVIVVCVFFTVFDTGGAHGSKLKSGDMVSKGNDIVV